MTQAGVFTFLQCSHVNLLLIVRTFEWSFVSVCIIYVKSYNYNILAKKQMLIKGLLIKKALSQSPVKVTHCRTASLSPGATVNKYGVDAKPGI